MKQILNERKHARAGAHPSNLSPYSTVVQYLFEAERSRMLTLLSNEKSRRKVLIPQELELPAGVDKGKLKNAIFVEKAIICFGPDGKQVVFWCGMLG